MGLILEESVNQEGKNALIFYVRGFDMWDFCGYTREKIESESPFSFRPISTRM